METVKLKKDDLRTAIYSVCNKANICDYEECLQCTGLDKKVLKDEADEN